MRSMTKILAALLIAAPLVATAQVRPDGPGGPPGEGRGRPSMGATPRDGAPREPGVTAMLNARRQLDLTPRQVAQLDSMERGLFTERKALMERMQGQRRALQQPGPQGRPISPDSMRARMQQLQPQMAQWRQRDSSALASAERLLTEPQRQKLREIRAYARGRADAMRQSRGPRGGQRMPRIEMRPMQGMPRGNEEVEVEIRRDRPGQEVIIERRMTRPPL
jgi:hypothetical protein